MDKKTITIEDLAMMTQKELLSLRQDMIKGFNRLEESNKLILKRLEGMVYRTEFEQLEIRVSELENLLAFNGKKH
ncbi:MAG: hypothetical protein WC309_01330 [Candidatus Paceibacterota bacterium]|jgi:hypothetical protein|nr:hypothetical protein [Candidatus Paceibacterota bacterium]MDD5621182.1 hypothetical protein [Candidatus Paceibacterota bacterium]